MLVGGGGFRGRKVKQFTKARSQIHSKQISILIETKLVLGLDEPEPCPCYRIVCSQKGLSLRRALRLPNNASYTRPVGTAALSKM